MRRTEDHHNSGEQVREYVREAIGVADDCELSDADRATLLPTILSLVSNKQVFYEQVNLGHLAGGLPGPPRRLN